MPVAPMCHPMKVFLITSNNFSKEKGFSVSFKVKNKWQTPTHVNLGEPLNKEWTYYCPYMSSRQQVFLLFKKIQ